MAIVMFFRVRCDGPCRRFLSDVTTADTPSMTSRPAAALVFTTEASAVSLAARVLPKGLCPRCTKGK